MDQALSTFFYDANTIDNFADEFEKKNDCVTSSVATLESDDMSSSNDDDVSQQANISDCNLSSTKPMRDISAPFQPSPRPTPRFAPMTEQERPLDRVDYITTVFQSLEADADICYEKYVGPTPESNWVIPGKLLVGAYPASQDDTETFELITSILKNGITKFVCLQLEYKSDVTESQWRSGQALRPYFEDVSLLVKNKKMFKVLADDSNVCSPEDLSFVHFPIKDCSVTDDGGVFNLAVDLVKAIAEGQVLYLHCWGGHGRTGTLVCIMLHLMYNLNATEAMAYCQRTHDLRQCPVVVGSPQTRSQCDQVRRIVAIMRKQEQRHLQTIDRGSGYNEEYDDNDDAPTSIVRQSSRFTFEECPLEQLAGQEELIFGEDEEGEEELLCKRMAGKSFDAVEEDGIYHVDSDSSPQPCSINASNEKDNSNANLDGKTICNIVSSPQKEKQGIARVSTTASSLNQLPATSPSTQPPLKFRLVEKDANRTRNAYTQKVLGQIPMKSLPPNIAQTGSPKKVLGTSTHISVTRNDIDDDKDTLPVVASAQDNGSGDKGGKASVTIMQNSSPVKASESQQHVPTTNGVQAQPPNQNQLRSSNSWKGGHREIRTQLSTDLPNCGDGIEEGSASELQKCSEVSNAVTTNEEISEHNATNGHSQSRKWSLSNVLGIKNKA